MVVSNNFSFPFVLVKIDEGSLFEDGASPNCLSLSNYFRLPSRLILFKFDFTKVNEKSAGGFIGEEIEY